MPTQPATFGATAASVTTTGASIATNLATNMANQMLVRQMSPLYRARAEAFNESLDDDSLPEIQIVQC